MSDSSNTVKDRVERKLDQFEQISSSQEAQAQVAVLPLTTVHEARYALQQLKEQFINDPQQLVEVIEPLSRIIGWVEATSYFLDITTQRDAVKSILGNVMAPNGV